MRSRNKREDADFGLSFLDCICCGFGAIVLLFVITMGSANQLIQSLRDRLQEVTQRRLSELEQLESQEVQVARRVEVVVEEIEQARKQESQLNSMLDELALEISLLEAGRQKKMVEIEEEKTEIASMQKELVVEMELPDINLPVGLPVESNYIAFVFDTSGSMRNWMQARESTRFMFPLGVLPGLWSVASASGRSRSINCRAGP